MLAVVLVAVTLFAHPPKPHIVSEPIPYPAKRRAEMTAYAKRHYGIASHVLHPRAIVEHVTATTTFASAYNTFKADVPDPELHELPGTCAHFIVDRNGTIYQLVRLNLMCRHTVGLNWAAIGIEHVGLTDGQVLADDAQMHASLALTVWLMWKYKIPLADVIGHNESLSSPLHKELYAPWRCQTHADWNRADMSVYRGRLVALARTYRLRVGRPPALRPTGC